MISLADDGDAFAALKSFLIALCVIVIFFAFLLALYFGVYRDRYADSFLPDCFICLLPCLLVLPDLLTVASC